MNWLDLTLLAILALFGLRGYFKGLFREVFSLAGIGIGFVVAVRYYETVAAFGQPFWHFSPLILKGAAYVAIFFVVYFLISSIGWWIHRSARLLFLQTVNRVGGVAIGIGKGLAVTALAVFLAGSASWLPRGARDNMNGALLVLPLSRLAETLIRLGKEKVFTQPGGAARTPELDSTI